jgi:uncharacterized membrane protein YoaK (UPF0700 family)
MVHVTRIVVALACAMTAASGAVDVLTLTSLGGVFSSAMTGNLVFLGLAVGQWNTPLATRAALALLVYGLGVLSSQPVLTRRNQGGNLWPI